MRKREYKREQQRSSKKKIDRKFVSTRISKQDAVELVTDLEEDDAQALVRELEQAVSPDETLAEESGDIGARQARWLLARADHKYFAREYLPHHFKEEFSENFHTSFFSMLMDVETHSTTKPTVVSAPRDFGKSTCGNLLMPCHALHFPFCIETSDGKVIDLSKRYIAYMSATQGLAKKPMSALIHEIETNERLHADFGNLYLDEHGRRNPSMPWSHTVAVTGRGQFIEAHGRYTKIRGLKNRELRPDLWCADDIEDDKSVQSAGRRQEDVDWFNKALVNTLAEDNGNALVLGTLLHPGSMLAQLMEFGSKNGWNVHVYPIYEDTPEGRVYAWPQRFGAEWVEQKLKEIPQSAFEQEYLQNPNSGRRDIDHGAFSYYELRDIQDRLNSGTMLIVNGVDPACRTTEKSDYTAIVPVALDYASGVKYVLPVTLSHMNLMSKVSAIISEHMRWHAYATGIETVQFQIALKEAVDRQAREQHVTVNTMEVKQTQDKRLRISRLYGPIQAGTIKFLRTATHATLVDQLVNLYSVQHDDAADALEISMRCIDDICSRVKRKSSVRAHII